MHQIEPMITTFDDALNCIATYGRPGATWFDAYPQALVLQGGSLRHPITISLTYSTHGHKMFRDYLIFDHYRLVIRDDLYRTKYALDETEHAELKTKMLDFCRQHSLCVAVRSAHTLPEYLTKAAEEFFAGSGVKWKVKPPRQRPQDMIESMQETIAGLMSENLHLQATLSCPACRASLTSLLLCPTCGVRYELTPGELNIIGAFYQRVCARAEATIERTHQIAGAHYAAMQIELGALRNAARVATESLVHWPQIEPAADQARAVTPLEQEIAWHQTHHGKSGHGADFETGFIAGLQHALAVEQQAISVLLDVAAGELLDRDELIATLRLWQGVRDE